jgi:hypothetical protein
MKSCKLLLLFYLLGVLPAAAQEGWNYHGSFNFGGTLQLVGRKGQQFPGLKLFCGFSAVANYKNHFVVGYGPSFTIYTKTVGANLNPLVGDVQMDFVNSITLGGAWNDTLDYYKQFRTLGNSSYYNIEINNKDAILFTTNFIFNNHRRHQIVGAFATTFDNFTLCYYNDGGFPFDRIPLSDHFDRYWTGGLGLFFHNPEGYNKVEFTFDQFTGYQPMLYEISTLLGIQIPSYNVGSDDRRRTPPDYNTSAYNLRIFPDRGFGIDIGLMGAVKSTGGNPFGLQDIIHMLGGYALHPNYDDNRYYIGGTYSNSRHVRL